MVLQRHRVLASLLLVLTFVVTAIVFLIRPWTYQASATVTFIPSQSYGVAEGGGNRYLAFTTSLNELGDIISYEVTSSTEENSLAAVGDTSTYTITDPNTTATAVAPILLISSTGSGEANVESTLTALIAQITSQLDAMQAGFKAPDKITDKVLTVETTPIRTITSKERSAIISFVAVLVVSLVIVLVVDSIQTRRTSRERRRPESDQSVSVEDTARALHRSPAQPWPPDLNSSPNIESERGRQPEAPRHSQDYGPGQRSVWEPRVTRSDEHTARHGY